MSAQLPPKLPLLALFLFCTLACQDQVDPTDSDVIDEDMIEATRLADEYLTNTAGKSGADRSITVLKYKSGKLYYHTNNGYTQGYEEVDESTVTATVAAGDYVFWYSGGGVTDLDGIEFDAASQQQLNSNPEEINYDKMWVIPTPENAAPGTILKYDIVYDYKGNDGPIVRLDPKIQIQ